jgi:hypothetical protein
MRIIPTTILMGAAAIGLCTAYAQPAQAQAQSATPFPYTFAYVNYAMTDVSSNGFEIGGSIEVTDEIHAFLAYQDWEFSNNFDRRTWQLGAGYRWALSPNADVIAHAAWGDTRIRRPGPPPNIDNSGLIIGGTIRGRAAENLELVGSILLDNSVRSGVDAVLEFGGQYYFNSAFSLGGRIRLDEDDSTLFLGGRYHFGGGLRRSR